MFELTSYFIVEEENGRLILWNVLYSIGYIISNQSEKSKVLSVIKNKKSELIEEEWFSKLLKYKIFINSEDKKNEHKLVDLLHYDTVFSDKHMSITILPTDKCNLGCIYCYQSELHHEMSDNVQDSIVKMIGRDRTLTSLHISWFGGEPLYYKEKVFSLMEKINEVCKKNKIVLYSDMTTNATLLDLNTFNRLIKLKVTHYQITVDGPKNTHDLQRPFIGGKGSYDLIIKNLEDIKNLSVSNIFKIGIRTNFTDLVHENMGDFINVLNEKFSGDDRFYFFFQWVKDWGGERVENLVPTLLSDREAVKKYGIWMEESTKANMYAGNKMQIKVGSGLCVASRKKSFIVDWNGDLHKCTTALYDDDYKEMNKIGRITPNGSVEIDMTKHSAWIVRDDNYKLCYSCNMYPICMGMPCPFAKIKKQGRVCFKGDDYFRVLIKSLAAMGVIKEDYYE